MPALRRLSSLGRVYVATVILFGFAIVARSLWELATHPVGLQWYLLVALTLISGSATVKLPSVSASISISETFVFAAVLLYGPAAGAVTVALDGLVISYWISKRRHEFHRALFNMSAPSASAWCSAQLFFWMSGIPPLTAAPATVTAAPAVLLGNILPALFAFAIAYFGFNSWLIALAISLESKVPPLKIWRENFVWLSLNYFCGASVAALLVTYTRELDIRFVGVTIPLLLLLYFTFKISMARVEDANKHVAKVNRMYLSTIETLAMAIDAKDQVTHGHIRRVQRYAVGLAGALGVKDDSLLKAIEAAALLHDMGKLAIPEHILNKPGRLTEAEFEKMKEHATIGAEILSSIDFPYPVVPIVRHHHESWDGTGYPSGLRGTDIPIGARILAVVDCFDALTSDRPYRKALLASAAMAIVRERAGFMYDPWVVETFEQIHRQLNMSDSLHTEQLNVESSMTMTAQLSPAPLSAAAAASPSHWTGHQTNHEVVGDSSAIIHFSDVDEGVVERIHCLMPAATAVFFKYESNDDALVGAIARGALSKRFIGARIHLGERLTGWVASNRRAMINCDANLDLVSNPPTGNSLASHRCVGVPVLSGSQLVGVLSIYAPRTFSHDDLRLLRTIANDSMVDLQV